VKFELLLTYNNKFSPSAFLPQGQRLRSVR
jgi:hypothetical protein